MSLKALAAKALGRNGQQGSVGSAVATSVPRHQTIMGQLHQGVLLVPSVPHVPLGHVNQDDGSVAVDAYADSAHREAAAFAVSPATWESTDKQFDHADRLAFGASPKVAFDCAVSYWLGSNPVAPVPGICTYCAESGPKIITLPGNHFHGSCMEPWLAQRRAQAVAALATMEIVPPSAQPISLATGVHEKELT
jgi:hypothetical protein